MDRCQRQGPQQDAEAGQDIEGKAHRALDLPRLGRGGAARPAEEGDAEGAHEDRGGECGGQGQDRARHDHGEFQLPGRQLGAAEDRLEGEPFRDEAVEGRQGREAGGPDQEAGGGGGQAMDQPAQPLEIALARGGDHRAGAAEQQPLEQGVVEGMEKGGGQRQACKPSQAGRPEDQRQPEAKGDDADVLDGRIGQQLLQIALPERIERPHEGGRAAQRDQDQPRPPAGILAGRALWSESKSTRRMA